MTYQNIIKIKNSYRHDVVKLLSLSEGNIGVELGVAKGIFSSRMVDSGYFSSFIGIDMYGDTYHDVGEYKEALRRVGLLSNYKLLRMTFDEAYDLFEDESLDFIYIDGYAHNGEEGGQTIFNWSKKVKIGGVISGDDYHEDWPLVQEAVHEFINVCKFDLYITSNVEKDPYSNYPSWACIKTDKVDNIEPSSELLKRGRKAERPSRSFSEFTKGVLYKILGKKIVFFIKNGKFK